MEMERKAPPQAAAESDSKPPASSMPMDVDAPSPAAEDGEGKAGDAVAVAAAGDFEVVDVVADMHLRHGDDIEIKWTLIDEEADPQQGTEAHHDGRVKEEEDEGPKDITVWWAATLREKTGAMHALTPEERRESEGACDARTATGVQVPIYTLDYSPLKEHGFEDHSIEDVAFISSRTLLNLSTDEMMTFRKTGDPSPPPSPAPDADGKFAATADSVISREFTSQDQMDQFLNQLMTQCLKSTGMEKIMKSLPASEQAAMAGKIARAREGFLEKLLGETEKMEAGNKVITAEVVNRCTAQMKGAY